MIKTAEEFFNEMLKKNDECTSTEMMIEFAKMHVKYIRYFISDGLNNYDESIKVSEIWEEVNKKLKDIK